MSQTKSLRLNQKSKLPLIDRLLWFVETFLPQKNVPLPANEKESVATKVLAEKQTNISNFAISDLLSASKHRSSFSISIDEWISEYIIIFKLIGESKSNYL